MNPETEAQEKEQAVRRDEGRHVTLFGKPYYWTYKYGRDGIILRGTKLRLVRDLTGKVSS